MSKTARVSEEDKGEDPGEAPNITVQLHNEASNISFRSYSLYHDPLGQLDVVLQRFGVLAAMIVVHLRGG